MEEKMYYLVAEHADFDAPFTMDVWMDRLGCLEEFIGDMFGDMDVKPYAAIWERVIGEEEHVYMEYDWEKKRFSK